MNSALHKLNLAKNLLGKNVPFFNTLLEDIDLQLIENNENFPFYAGVGYDQRKDQIILFFNEDILKTAPVIDIAAILEHECYHLAFDHLFVHDIHQYDAMTLNMAQDYIINDNCYFIKNRYDEIMATHQGLISKLFKKISKKENILKNACLAPYLKQKFRQLRKRDIGSMNHLELYNLLYKNKKSRPNNKVMDQHQNSKSNKPQPTPPSNQQPQQNPKQKHQESDKNQEKTDSENKKEIKKEDPKGDSSLDKEKDQEKEGSSSENKEGDEKKDSGNDSLKNEPPKEKVKETFKEAIKKHQDKNKSFGNLSQQLENYILEVLPTNLATIKAIKNFWRKTLKSKKVSNWKKVHKKHPYLIPGKVKTKEATIVVAFDTSGSMNDKTFRQMCAFEIKSLSLMFKKVYFVAGDTKLQYDIEILKNKFKLENIKFLGGGGTDLQFCWDFAKEKKVDGLVVHTDGYIPKFNDYKIPTVFITYPNGQEVSNYKNIRIKHNFKKDVS
jgi:predicted metal-dependent peptidase